MAETIVLDMKKIQEILEEIAGAARNWGAILDQLRAHLGDDAPAGLEAFYIAFGYYLVDQGQVEQLERWGPLAPMMEFADGQVFPQPLQSVPVETLQLWDDILKLVTNPILVSRLADLLWLRRYGQRPDKFARQAADAYLHISTGDWSPLFRVEALIRSLGIAREVNDPALQERAIAQMIELSSAAISAADPIPGVTMQLIDALLGLPKKSQPRELDELIDLAAAAYQSIVHVYDAIIAIKINRVAPEDAKGLHELRVDIWEEEATKSRGLVRAANLQQALDFARDYGLSERAEKIRKSLQEIDEAEFDLKTVSASVEIPQDELEVYISSFVAESGWQESLSRYGAYGPPSGEHQSNLEVIATQMREHPLQFLVTGMVYGEFGIPVFTARTQEEHQQIVLSRHESMGIQFFGEFAPTMLERIVKRHGQPSIEELATFFKTELISVEEARDIAEAIDWHFRGNPNVAAHLLVPKLERVIRTIAREVGLAVVVEARGSNLGGILGLGSLLDKLRGRFDESWRRYYSNVLTNQLGLNLRNRICHGLVERVGERESALLIQLACNLRLIGIVTRDSQ